MTGDTRGGNGRFRTAALLAGTGIGMLHLQGAYADDSAADAPSNKGNLEEVYVFGQKDAYKQDTSTLPKLTAPIIDTPQSINTISEQELQDRAITDLNGALRTVP